MWSNTEVEEPRALTVAQPWAWAIVQGFKDVENRAWRTSHRGRLLVHAGNKVDPDGFLALWEMGLYRRLPETLPQGRLVGSVELVDIVSGYPSNWAARGAWHWLFRRAREFLSPIPCRGGQKLFIPDVSHRALGQANRHAIRHRQRGD
ncbi:MAG: ASCH domain-containing protein [Actinomycetota bacterium]|nr:ASCH domain-containing protein [Actinomycetota bacterium]